MIRYSPLLETRTGLRTILSAGVLAVLLLACAGTAAGATWVVDDDGGADFTSIQAAVNAAAAGDTIEVRSGMYVENVDVNKTLTLVGEGADVVTVRAADAENHVFNVTEDYVNISGFNATGTTASHPLYAAGIYLSSADHCDISENAASNNYRGICISSSNYNTLTNNIASNNYYGIHLYSWSNYNTLANNTANSNNVHGIYLDISIGNNIQGNNVNNNSHGIYLFSSSNNNIQDNNASNNGNGIYLDYSINNNIQDNNIQDNIGKGIYLKLASNNNNLQDNNINNNVNGIHLYSSSNNNIQDNNASNNRDGIHIRGSGNTLANNTANSNSRSGIYLLNSVYNDIMGNTASNNQYGIYLSHSSVYNDIMGNTASNNQYGIYLSHSSDYNDIMGNTASNNQYGIYLSHSSDYNTSNTLCHNNLIDNTNCSAYDSCTNQWDSGSEGNYYSDYTGTDSDGDGIGDTPYTIPGGGSVDRYPLMFFYNEQLHETRKEVYSISTSTTNIFQVDDDIINQISTENPDPTVANEKLRACVVSEKEDSSTDAVLDAAETEQQRIDIQDIIDANSGDFEQTTEEINDYVETSVSDPIGLWDRAKEKFFSTTLPKNTIIDINAANAVTRVFGEFSGAFKKFFWAGKAVTVVDDVQTQHELEQRLDEHAVPSDVSNNLKAVSRVSRAITQLEPTTYFSTLINGNFGMLIKVTTKLSDRQVVKPAHYNEEWEYIWDQVDVLLDGTNDVYADDNGGYAQVYENPEDGLHYIYLQGEPKTNFWGKLFGSRESGRWREVEEQYDGTWRIIPVSGSSSSSLPKALTFSLGKVATAAQTSEDTDPIKIYDIFTQDLDNDGYADIIGFDTTGDGKPDINMTDLNNDSLIDLWEFEDNGTKITGYDITGDGTSDVYDTNEDGAADVWDLDGDGSPDQMDADYDGRVDAYDTDYNGALDTFVEFDHEIVAWIDSLSYGETFLQNDSVMLNGSVYNGTNEAVPPYNFTWASDKDGIIGTGNNITYFNLSVGDHIITLMVQDSNSSTGNDTVPITITQKGDLDHDGNVTSADIRLALDIAFSGEYVPEADIDANGCVNVLDARMIMQAAAGRIEL